MSPELIDEILIGADFKLVDRFKRYHVSNPHVWEKFKEFSRLVKSKGRKKYSGWTIINAIRWKYDTSTMGDSFKINNDYIALYTRMMIHEDPSFVGFFELRTMKPTDRRESSEEKYRNRQHCDHEDGYPFGLDD